MFRIIPMLAALAVPLVANAATTEFIFSQAGFTNGGVFSGSLLIDEELRMGIGIERNSNVGVVSAEASFVGNAVLPDLSFTTDELLGLEVDLSSGQVNRLQFKTDISVVPAFLAFYFPSEFFSNTQIGRTAISGPGTGGSADNQFSSETITLVRATPPPPSPAPIPLPATAWLLAATVGGLGLARRRRRDA